MTPTEARLYMIEARLRNEENKRIQAVDKVTESIGEIKRSQSRTKRSKMEWQRASLSETLQTPTALSATLDREIRTVMSPGGMPASRHRRRRRTQNLDSGLSIQSMASNSYTVPLISPFDQITINTSQKEMMTIYKDFSPAVYSGKSASRESKTGEGERKGNTPKMTGKRKEYADHRVPISSVISPEAAKSLPGSREPSPTRFVSMQVNEAVQFEGITEEV